MKYVYEQDFSVENDYIKSSQPTKRQLNYLEKLSTQNGFQLCNTEYLSKNYATSLIEYLNEQGTLEPINFNFFMTAV